MHRLLSLFIVVAAAVVAAGPGCTTVTCGVGTIEKNGECAPANEQHDPSTCGSGTTLVGDRCVSTVTCGDHTMPVVGSDGSVSCVGNEGTLDCTKPIPCDAPAPGKMAICGQLYDAETMMPFRPTTGSADGTQCTTAATDGPCALRMDAYDAFLFASNALSGSAQTPLQTGATYIDNCGRYRFEDVPMLGSPLVGLGFDDKDAANMGPAGVTNAVGVATAFAADTSVYLEAFVAKKSTTDQWGMNGGPSLATGFHVTIFRKHVCDLTGTTCSGDPFETQTGVQNTKMGQAVANNDFYFSDTDAGHTTINTSLTSTGSDGTSLITGASPADSLNWSAQGGITDTTNCQWEKHAAASLPGIVTFQIYRPTNQIGKTCNQ